MVCVPDVNVEVGSNLNSVSLPTVNFGFDDHCTSSHFTLLRSTTGTFQVIFALIKTDCCSEITGDTTTLSGINNVVSVP